MYPHQQPSHRKPIRPRSWAIWIGLVALTVSLLSPMLVLEASAASQSLASRQEAEDCEEGFVFDRESGTCIEEPQLVQIAECDEGEVRNSATGTCEPIDTGEDRGPDSFQANPTEAPPTHTPTPLPIAVAPTETVVDPPPPAPATGWVQMHKRSCPEDFVPDDSTMIDELQSTCTEAPQGVAYSTYAEGELLASAATDATGVAQLGELAAGTITVIEDVPAGYGEPIVYCISQYAFQPPEPSFDETHRQTVYDGNAIGWNLEQDTLLVCYWYNISSDSLGGSGDLTTQSDPQALEEQHMLTNTKFRCPYGAPYEDLGLDLMDVCTEPMGNVSFTVNHEGGSGVTWKTDITGELSTYFPPPGGVYVEEHIPPGYLDPYVFCRVVPEEGGVSLWITHTPLPNGQLVTTMPDDVFIEYECRWYNIPSTPNTIEVWKWECPAGLGADEGASEDFQVWQDTCTSHPAPIEFTVADSNGEFTKYVDGNAIWHAVATGEFSITEHTPPAFHEPLVFCGYEGNVGGAPAFGDPTMVPVTDSTIALNLHLDTFNATCHFFNVEDERNSFTNIKYLCPAGYDPTAEDADPFTDCPDTMDGVTFSLSDGNAPDPDMTRQSGDDGPGTAIFRDIDPGSWTITEEVPAGIVAVFAACPSIGNGPAFVDNPPRVEFDMDADDHWGCSWFNIPEAEEDNTIEIWKWECPEWVEHGQDLANYQDACVSPHDGVEFTVSSDLGLSVAFTAGGFAEWTGLPGGVVGVQETIPEGFGAPVVFCWTDGPEGWQEYPAPTGHWEFDFGDDDVSTMLLKCYVFNIPGEPGSVTINKWTCPPGYDLFAAGADPKTDCTEATNGIEFAFGAAGPPASQTTGDILDGAVVFDGLEPDMYNASEVIPTGIEYVFVLECTGHIMGVLQPYPLQLGASLDLDVDAGEHLVCEWFNVPEVDGGKLTLFKYICSTETFLSEVDCEVYEDGATFDLLWWDGAEWQAIDTETTDGFGRIGWVDLDPGSYWLDEQDGEWCHITANAMKNGEAVFVNDGEETVVKVYNCDSDWPTITIPKKYPDTGAPPAPSDSSASLPGAALVAGIMGAAISRRRFIAAMAGGMALPTLQVAAQGNATPTATEQQPNCLPTTNDDVSCERGDVPAGIQISAITVDAPIEILEIVGGVMEQPSDEIHVAWYKESARLGEIGNMLLAAHLNWWRHPRAVFADLGLLVPGDEVVVLDEDDTPFSYSVEWVRQESNLEAPREEVVGPTDHEAVTLITCSGEWNADINEYDQRTVVRATRSDPSG